MKRSVLALLAITISISFAAIVSKPPQKRNRKAQKVSLLPKKTKHEEPKSTEGMEDDAGERLAWELKRLADPATGKIPDNVRQKELAFAATLPKDIEAGVIRRGIPPWTNRGPWNVGGRTRAFGVDVSNESHLLAGSCSGGMWLSTDGGSSWTASNTNSQLKNATCLVQDTRSGHTNVWYYGSGEGYGASPSGAGAYYLGDGLFKSTDGGASWTQVGSTAGGSPQSFSTNWQLVWNVALDPSAADTNTEVYAACYNAVYRSVNGGTSWTLVRQGNSYFTDVAVTSQGVVYATLSSDGSQKGIWRSTDGITFTNITPANFPTSFKRIVIGIDPNNENNVYFLAHTPNFGKLTRNYLGEAEYNSFYRYTYVKGNGSGDTGGLWKDLTANLPSSGGPFDKWNVQGSYDMVVKVKPGDSNSVFIGGTNLYRSTTAFKDSTHTTFIGGYEQFSKLPTINSYANHHPDQHGLVFSPSNPNVMFSTNDGGLFKTLDNTASTMVWQPLNNGYLTSMFYTVSIDHATSGDNVIIGGAQDNGSWFTNNTDPVHAWVQPRGGDGSFCAIADGKSTYYFSIQNAKMMKTTLDINGNKTAFTRIDPIGLKNYKFINPFVLDPNNNNIMYLAGGKYLWRNSDLSGIPMMSGWDSITTNWTRWADSIPNGNIFMSAVSVCKTPANRVYYGTDVRRIYKVDSANTGTHKPVDITSTTSGVIFPGGSVSCIATDPRDGNKLMVIFSNYNAYSVFYSEDGGSTWSKQGGNLEPADATGPSVRWASIIPVADGTIYMLATSTGVYATTTLNGLNTIWVQQGTNTIGNAVCDMIDFRTSDGLVVVATHAGGMYSATFTSVNNIVSVKDIQNSKYQPHLNVFPNPATTQITANFSFTYPGLINLEIWDECGRILRTFNTEYRQAGEQQFEIPCQGLKPGVYYLRAKNENAEKVVSFIIRN